MKRRAFITLLGGAASWPLAARAQQAERMRRVGIFMNLAESDPEGQQRVTELRKGLERTGWIEGRNIQIDVRWAAGDSDRLDALAQELVDLQPHAIVGAGTPVVAALRRATTTITIVFAQIVDPLGQRVVASLAKPEGNVTGFANFEFSMAAKWVELLQEIAPRVTRVAVIYNPDTSPYFAPFLRAIEAAARPLGMTSNASPVQTVAEIERAIVALGSDSSTGLVVPPDSFTSANRARLIALAAVHRLPVAYSFRYFVADGGLISYGADTLDVIRRVPTYVDRILRGAKPGELPVQQPTKFELVINLKTAKALGLEVPPTLLARADEVIE
jgi:putative ABC transport system substrate-binding protein